MTNHKKIGRSRGGFSRYTQLKATIPTVIENHKPAISRITSVGFAGN
jgi:hypothetical protein